MVAVVIIVIIVVAPATAFVFGPNVIRRPRDVSPEALVLFMEAEARQQRTRAHSRGPLGGGE
jgi:hypothetical protein